jgi:transposase
MLSLTPQMRILVAVDAIDFRNGIDGLAGICRNRFQKDPLSGCMFVFRNRRGTSVKILVYDGQGFWLCQKRLSKGRFRWWPESVSEVLKKMESRELQLVLWDGDPSRAAMSPLWRGLNSGKDAEK